ncbi:MAG: transporter substrate-binding domain-containing protein, partial [Chloroflexota bacterium]|nr:transporter substrate-binding domain-containing protein [Chloroflexota bacterium]
LAMQKGNTQLKAALDKFISDAKHDGTLDSLQKKWWGQTFDVPANY